MQEIKKIGTHLTEYQHLFLTIKTSDNKYSFSEETITMPAGGFEKAYLFYINLPMRSISFSLLFSIRDNKDDSVF